MAKPASYKRMSLIIAPELLKAFKTATAAEGKTMTDVLIRFMEKYVHDHHPIATSAKKRGRK